MDSFKQAWNDIRPRSWLHFGLGVLCLWTGTICIYMDSWYNKPIGVFTLVMAGLSFSGSVLFPRLTEQHQKLSELVERLEATDPAAWSKQAAAAFKQQIWAMQARGELPPHAQIIFGADAPSFTSTPPERLN